MPDLFSVTTHTFILNDDEKNVFASLLSRYHEFIEQDSPEANLASQLLDLIAAPLAPEPEWPPSIELATNGIPLDVVKKVEKDYEQYEREALRNWSDRESDLNNPHP